MKSFILVLSAILFISLYGCKNDTPVTPTDQSNISLISVYSTNASTNGVCVLPINLRNYALIADGTNGMQIIDVTLVNAPDSVASYNTNGSANDVTTATINSRLYAFISDYSAGLVIVDITSPINPTLTGSLVITGFVNTTFVDGNNQVAYVGLESGLVMVYDLSPLPNQPNLLSTISIGGGSVNGLYVSGSYLYIAGGVIGMEIVNISNPSVPVVQSVFNTTGIASDVMVNTNYAYVADSYNGMLILNVTDPASPVYSSKFTGTGQILGVYVNNNNAFTADNTYGIENVNVSNPNSPGKVGYIQTNSSASSIFYFGGYIFLAAAEGGLGIYQPTNTSDLR